MFHTTTLPCAGLATLAASLSLGSGPLLAQCGPDAFEPNETCPTAPPITPGLHTGLTLAPGTVDAYGITIPANHALEVDWIFTGTQPDLMTTLAIARDDGSPDPCASIANFVVNELFFADQPLTVSWSAGSAAEDVWIFAASLASGCIDHELDVRLVPDPCLQGSAVGLEDNDTCATAFPLLPGLYPGQHVSVGDRDFYAVTVPAGGTLSFSVGGVAAGQEYGAHVWRSGTPCGSQALISGVPGVGPSVLNLSVPGSSSVSQTYVFEVYPVPDQVAQTGFCMDYDMEVQGASHPCGALADQPLEPNDNCASGPWISGLVTGLDSYDGDTDWYTVAVPARSTLRVRATPETRPMTLHIGCGAGQVLVAVDEPLYADLSAPGRRLEWANTGPWSDAAPPAARASHRRDATLRALRSVGRDDAR